MKAKSYKVTTRPDGQWEVSYTNPQTHYRRSAVGTKICLDVEVDGKIEKVLETKAQTIKRLCDCLGIEY